MNNPLEPHEEQRARELLGDDTVDRLLYWRRQIDFNTRLYRALRAAKRYFESMHLVRNNVYDEIKQLIDEIDDQNKK